jgi:hypothetical protein
MQYTEKELNSLISEVEREFASHLAKAEEGFKLSKSENLEDEPEKKDKEKASKESHSESDKKMESESPEDKGVKDQHQQDTSKDHKGGPMESKEGREKSDEKENSRPHDDEDMQELHSLYGSMTKPELKDHHDVIRKCMDNIGLAKCEDSMAKAETEDKAEDEGYRPNGGPKDGESKAEKGPACSDAQALNKSESSIEISLLKSELEASKAKAEASEKSLVAVESFLKKFVEKTAPAGKAITSLDIIAKTESVQKEKPLSKSEIDAKLLAKAKDVSLSKSDREAINSYYFSKNIEKVSHLLK